MTIMIADKNLARLATLALLSFGCGVIPVDPVDNSGTTVIGSGNVVTESRAVSGFNTVSVHGVARIEVERTGEETLTITADDNVIPFLLSSVEDGRLNIGPDEDINLENHGEIVYHLHVRDLIGIEIDGVIHAEAIGLDTDSLAVDVLGVSHLMASGRVRLQDVLLSGVSTYQAQALASEEVTINGDGVITAVVQVSDSLTVDACGVGSIKYIGTPAVALLRNCPSLAVTRR